MEEINKYTIEKLIQKGSFSSLSDGQKEFVLKEMTAKEFNQFRKVMIRNTPFISIDKFNIEPNPDIEKTLLNKLKFNPARKPVLRQLYIYGSSAAAILILLFLAYTYFFQEPYVSENQSIVEEKNKTKSKESIEEIESKEIESVENEKAFIAEKETNPQARKKTTSIAQSKDKEETKPGENLEEFKSLAPEELALETDDDADLARFTDESQRVFHYYTRMN